MAGTVNSTSQSNVVKNYLDQVSSTTDKKDGTTTTGDNSQTISEVVKNGTSTKTGRGTRIVKPGQEMDKNAFLRILSSELANQDPQNAKDGTEYVAQMAQFAGLEQSANLNKTMRMTGATALMGKYATLNIVDPKTGQLYNGEVIDTVKNGDDVKISVVVGTHQDEKGNTIEDIKSFAMDDLNRVENMIDPSKYPDISSYILNSPALLGKNVEALDKDGKNYAGIAKEIFRDNEGMKVKVEGEDGTIKDLLLQNIIRIK